MLNHPPEYLTTGQIAGELGVSETKVRQWIDAGELRAARLPQVTRMKSHRRVHRSAYEAFRVARGFIRKATEGLVLAVVYEVEVVDVDALTVVNASSSFDAGIILSSRSPEFVVVNWELGSIEVSQISRGCTHFGYAPKLVIARPLGVKVDPAEFMRLGYRHYVVGKVTGQHLRSLV